jgi:hypothetical protein
MRFDLTTGAVTQWFRRPGAYVEVLGTDAIGHPIVRTSVMADSVTSISQSLWVVGAPKVATQIYAGPGSKDPGYADFLGEPLQSWDLVWIGARRLPIHWIGPTQEGLDVAGLIAGRCS